MRTKHLFGCLFLAATLALVNALGAQPSAPSGAISGRVFNPATGEYVRTAEIVVVGRSLSAVSADGGFFSLSNVPAGDVELRINYTGYESEPAQLRVEAGGTARHDFN